MKNKVLNALTEFVLNNYESLKSEYNTLSKEQKKTTPITIYIIKTFDVLLNQAENELKNTMDEGVPQTQVDSNL